MHLAMLLYMKHPFFLEYLLPTTIALNVENKEGYVSWFYLCHFTDDFEFEKLFNLIMKHRPHEMNLNLVSGSGKCQGETLLHLVMARCPTYHKLKIFIDYDYDFQSDSNILDRIIKLINKSNYSQCSIEERT